MTNRTLYKAVEKAYNQSIKALRNVLKALATIAVGYFAGYGAYTNYSNYFTEFAALFAGFIMATLVGMMLGMLFLRLLYEEGEQ